MGSEFCSLIRGSLGKASTCANAPGGSEHVSSVLTVTLSSPFLGSRPLVVGELAESAQRLCQGDLFSFSVMSAAHLA